MDKLKPCPFCGFEEPVVTARAGRNGFRDRYAVLCDYNDGGCGAEGGWYHSREEAVGAWNARAENAWVSVKDRLPPLDTEVLVSAVNKYTGERQTVITYMKGSTYFGSKEIIFHKPEWNAPYQYFLTNNTITHWRKLPEGPEDETEADDD